MRSIQSRHHHYPFLRAVNQPTGPLVSLFILHLDWVYHWPLLVHSNWGTTGDLSNAFFRAPVLSLSPASGGPQLAQGSLVSLFPVPQLAFLTCTTLLRPPCSSSHLLCRRTHTSCLSGVTPLFPQLPVILISLPPPSLPSLGGSLSYESPPHLPPGQDPFSYFPLHLSAFPSPLPSPVLQPRSAIWGLQDPKQQSRTLRGCTL